MGGAATAEGAPNGADQAWFWSAIGACHNYQYDLGASLIRIIENGPKNPILILKALKKRGVLGAQRT